MKTKLAAALVGVALAIVAVPAKAQSVMPMVDPSLVQGIEELVARFGDACRMGEPDACQMGAMAQQQGYVMLDAGAACRMGNPQACVFYQQTFQMLSMQLAQIRQQQMVATLQQPPMVVAPVPDPLGATHEARMNSIEAWGQNRLAWGQQQGEIMRQRNDAFMESLRK